MLRLFLSMTLALALLSLMPPGPVAPAGEPKSAPAPVARQQPRLVAQGGHSRSISSVAFSADGKLVLTGSSDKTARLWETTSGKELRRFLGHTKWLTSVAFSPDGKRVLTGSGDKTARLWETASGKELHRFLGHAHWVTAVAFSPDGRHVLTGSSAGTARLWEANTGRELWGFKGHTSTVDSVAFSPNGQQVLTGSLDTTARLWEVASGKELRCFQGHTKWVSSVAFSADARQVLTGSGDTTARLWDAATGNELRRFLGHTGWVSSVAISADARQVLTGSGDSTAWLWDAATGNKLRRFQGHTALVSSVAFSPDARQVLTGSADRTARLWETASGKEIRRFLGRADVIFALGLSADGKHVLTGSRDETARLWEVAGGKVIHRFLGHKGIVEAVTFSPDGRQVLTGGEDGTARLWETASGKELRRFLGHKGIVQCVAFSADGKHVLTGGGDRNARLWEAASGKEVRRFVGSTDCVSSVAFSPDGKQVLTGSEDQTARLWETASGKELRGFQGGPKVIAELAVAFSPNGKHVLTGGVDGTPRLWNPADGKEVRRYLGHKDAVTSVAFSADGKHVLTGSEDQTARLWETASGKELCCFEGHAGAVEAVAFSADGKHVLTGSSDQTTRIWEAGTGRQLCSLVSFRDSTWAVIDPHGRFDAANAGDVDGLHWVAGNEPIALKQLKERYYDPGLLAKYLGLNKEPLRDVAAFREVKLFPTATVQPPAADSSRLTVNLTNQGGGLGKVQVFVNGRELLADARGPKVDPDAAGATLTVDLAGGHLRPGQANQVRVVTWNAEGYLSSRGLDLSFVPAGRPDEHSPELYAIVAGVSKYGEDKLTLRFAAKDAQDMAAALRAGAKRLFGADKVHLTLLCDGDEPEALPPTRANLEKAFAAVKQSRPGDTLVVYLSGHGVAFAEGEQEVYCFLTKEAQSGSRETFRNDRALRRQRSITSTELTEWLKKVPAERQVLVLDTCAAGAAASKLTEHRDVGADQIRAIERMRDRTGFHVLMGCAADRVSYEASQYSQGVLTYALLQAMRGAKLREGAYVDVSAWFQYAADEVPLLARHVGGIQRPLVMAPRGTSFDIGQLLAEDRKAIPLAQVHPQVLRPVLLNADELADTLGLMPLLRKQLADAGYAQRRGQGQRPTTVFVDADELSGALRPSGTYTVRGDKISMKLVLTRDGEVVARLQVEGLRNDLPALAARLVTAIEAKASGP